MTSEIKSTTYNRRCLEDEMKLVMYPNLNILYFSTILQFNYLFFPPSIFFFSKLSMNTWSLKDSTQNPSSEQQNYEQ